MIYACFGVFSVVALMDGLCHDPNIFREHKSYFVLYQQIRKAAKHCVSAMAWLSNPVICIYCLMFKYLRMISGRSEGATKFLNRISEA